MQRATTPFQAPTCPYNLPTRLSPPTCRRPRVIYPLDGCFVLIYLESGAAVLTTSLITATQATSHRPTVDSRQVLRTRSETRLEGGSATKASRTWSSHQQVGKQEVLISPRIPHRRRSRSGSTLAPSSFPITLQDNLPAQTAERPSHCLILSRQGKNSTPASLLLESKTAEMVERWRSIQVSHLGHRRRENGAWIGQAHRLPQTWKGRSALSVSESRLKQPRQPESDA